MTGNIFKRKRDEAEPSEEDRDLEAFSNETHFVEFDKYGSDMHGWITRRKKKGKSIPWKKEIHKT